MKLFKNNFKIIYFLFIVAISFSQYDSFDYDFLKNKKDSEKPKVEPKKNKNSYENLIQSSILKSGLFDYYWDKDKVKCYIVINRNQLDKTFLLNLTRNTGDAYRYHGSAMMYEFPFSFRKVGSNIQMIAENVKFRADKDSVIFKAIANNITESIFSTAKIQAISSSDSLILIDASQLFIFDFPKVSNRGKYILDKKNSYFEKINSFEFNSELDMVFHYKGKKSDYVFTLPNSSSMLHKYHLSISELPTNNYKPRLLDDRVGHFDIIYQDYSNMLSESPYVRYITRWNLEKKNPKAKFSEPKEPIVFWIENTVPHKFRKAFRDGILAWNKSFEKIGFKNAIVAKQMPDDAEWDPADVRYNTIRWIITPGGGYAVGPSRANPYTGELYDADIRVSSDYVRWYGKEFDDWITPLSSYKDEKEDTSSEHMCNYADGKIEQMAFGWSLLSSRGIVNEKDKEKFIHDGLVDLIAHEVGHTLGLRHNFKASSIYSLFELKNKVFTEKNGVTGSVMDYNPVNLSLKGEPQGSWYHTTLGKYDYWAIEYAYSIYNPELYVSEEVMLDKIASKVSDPLLQYGTDEDARGSSVWGMDPSCSPYDLGKDPLEYAELRMKLSNELWNDILYNFEIDGERYQKIRRVFGQGWGEYRGAINIITKYIGGSYIYRDHIGDPGDRIPINLVSAIEQRRALQILNDQIFHKDAFSFSPDLLNKLLPERFWNFSGSVWKMRRLDYPIHNAIERLHARALYRIFNPLVLSRVQENEIRYLENEDKFTMSELFVTLRESIWSELHNRENINSYRRGLQRIHLETLINMIMDTNSSLSYDAIILARQDLVEIQQIIKNSQHMFGLDEMSKAHLSESSARIESALEAYLQKKL